MSNGEIIRHTDALEALGEEPMVWCDDDQMGTHLFNFSLTRTIKNSIIITPS